MSLLVADIDRFKQVNDRFGHPAGDEVLREVAAFLQCSVRADDITCRYGGEEFVVILPTATLQIGQQRAEELRDGMTSLRVSYRGTPLPSPTLSIGVAAVPEHGDEPDALVRAADEALYRAKAEGRNRVVSASPRLTRTD